MQEEPRNSSFFTPMRRDPSITLAAIMTLSYRNSAGSSIVGKNAADSCRCHKYDIRPRLREPTVRCGLAPQIDLAALRCEDLAVLTRQAPDQRTAHHAAMAGHKHPLASERKRHCRHL